MHSTTRRIAGALLLLATAFGPAACGGDGPADPAAASAKRVADIRKAAETPIDAIKKSACKDAAAEAQLSELVSELVGKHGATPGTHRALREVVDSGCPSVQLIVVVSVRELRPHVEGKPASSDLAELLAVALSSPDPRLRTHAAMTVYELHLDPRGTRAQEILVRIAETDLDEKPRQTAAWVREQVEKKYPAR